MVTGTEVMTLCNDLAGTWRSRNEEFKDMYKLLTMDNSKIKREGMEYIISNEPATFFNMAIHILTPNPLSHRILTFPLTREKVVVTSQVEDIIQRGWIEVDRDRRKSGKESWFRENMTYILLYAWYSVFVMADKNSLIADIWNPSTVYPEFTEFGTNKVARIINVSKATALSIAKSKGWKLSDSDLGSVDNVNIYDLWEFVGGKPSNVVSVESKVVKPSTPISWSKEIPVLTGTVNGLPDSGLIASSSQRQKNMGRGILWTNKDLYTKYNKQLTFRQQMMRDTSQPKYWQKLRGKEKVLTTEKLKQYGQVFTISEGEEVGLLQSNPLPAEMTAGIYSTEAALQRGAFPWTLYGNVAGSMSSFTMSQIAVAAQQVLSPYYEAFKNLVSDIDMKWLTLMKEQDIHPYGLHLPSGLPDDISIECDYKLFIPGDINQRATTMRMVSPNTELADITALDMFFPEIGDPMKEISRVKAGKALNSPITLNIELISAYRQRALELKASGDRITSDIYVRIADAMEKELMKKISGNQPASTENQDMSLRRSNPGQTNPRGVGLQADEGGISA